MNILRLRYFTLFSLFFLASCIRAAEVISINEFSGLNVDDSPITLSGGQTPDSQNLITDNGPGVSGRKGYVRYSTEPAASGMWEFPLSNGTRYLITRSGGYLKATTDGTFSVTIGTVPTDRTIAASVLGDRFYYADTLNGLKYWTGSTVVDSSASLKFSMLATFKGRLVGAGKSGSERVLYLSKYLDGTTWNLATNPSEDDPSQITVSGSLDENIQAIYSSFQDKLIWMKKNSFGGLYGSRRSNFSLRTFSDRIGIASVETIQDCDGKLRWLGNNRKVYEFDGANFGTITDQVDNIFEGVSQGDSNSRSTTLTLQADFSGGVSSNTETSISPGSVVLSTMASSALVDTTKAHFAGGTGINITSTIVNGSITLSTFTTNVVSLDYTSGETFYALDCGEFATCLWYQGFIAPSTPSILTSLTMCAYNQPSIQLRSDNSGTPNGTLLISSSVSPSGYCHTLSSILLNLTPNATYWISSNGSVIQSPYYSETEYPYSTSWLFREDCEHGCKITSNGLYGQDMKFAATFIGKDIYHATGSYVSRTFDIGTTTNSALYAWDNFHASGTIPNGSSVTYRIQSSPDGTNWTNPIVISSNSIPSMTVQRYVRYLSTFTSSTGLVTPQINDVIINTTIKRKPSGTYVSPAVDFGAGVTALGAFSPSATQTGGNITYEFQTATNSSSSLFLSTGWIAITPSFTSTAPVRRYGAFRSSFSATSVLLATAPLSLDAVTFNWSEGSNLKASSGYIDQRYWIGCAISSTSNNRVLVFDRNRQWQRYVGYAPEVMGMYNSRLYVGNTQGIFLSESGYDDNGTPITFYYTVKTLAPSSLDLYTKFNELRFTTDNSDAVLTPTYQVDENGTNQTLGSIAMNVKLGIQNLKFPFSTSVVQQGKFIALKFQAVGSSFWRLLNSNFYYDKDVLPD